MISVRLMNLCYLAVNEEHVPFIVSDQTYDPLNLHAFCDSRRLPSLHGRL